MPCDHLLGKGLPLGSHLWCLIVKLRFPIGILGQAWCLIVSIPDLCPLSYFVSVPNVLMLPVSGLSYMSIKICSVLKSPLREHSYVRC